MGIEEVLVGLVAGLVVVGPGLALWAARRTGWLEGLAVAAVAAGVWVLVRAECGGDGAGCALLLQGAGSGLLGWALLRGWRPGVLVLLAGAWGVATVWAVVAAGPPEAQGPYDGWSAEGALWALASTLVLGPLALGKVMLGLGTALVLPAGWLGGLALAMARPRRLRLVGLCWVVACVPAVRATVESGAHRALWSRVAGDQALPFPGMQLALPVSGDAVQAREAVEWHEVLRVEADRLQVRRAREPWEDGTGVRSDGSLPLPDDLGERWVSWPLGAGVSRLRW